MTTIPGRDPRTGQTLEITLDGATIAHVRVIQHETNVWIAPGLIDLQVNGYGGIDLNSTACTVDEVVTLTHRLARLGTTTYLPTIITAPLEKMAACLATIVAARKRDEQVRHAIPCVHLEGPHISPIDGYRGAHALQHVRPPSLEEFAYMQEQSGNLVGMVTLSPHWEGSAEFIRALAEQGIAVSLGHTHASPAQIHAAVDAGASLSTHLGNGIALELPRHPNPIWEQLAEDRLTACFIADGIHVSPETLRAMVRSKGLDRAILVSDSVALAGSPPGEYKADVGGDVVVGTDGSIRLRNSNVLAGSGIALKDAVARAVTAARIPLASAIAMATSHPGVFAASRGHLREGATADLITFRWSPGDTTLDIQDVLVRGQRV